MMECIDYVQNFISHMQTLPLVADSVDIDAILQMSIEAEERLRRVFAQDPDDPRLSDLYIGTTNVFKLPEPLRLTRARRTDNPKNFEKEYIMPIGLHLRSPPRRLSGTPSMVESISHFKANFEVFSMGVLRYINWCNVVVAGGAALACLTPVPAHIPIGKHFHTKVYCDSDIDIFIYGLNEEAARLKMLAIYEDIKRAIPFETTCIRKTHTVTIISQYPFRSIQIVLRLYRSPAEILAGFDLDSSCVLYNGVDVFANPRAIVAVARQCNTITVTRRSPSYEYRLLKYHRRGYEIRYPKLNRGEIRESIFDLSASELPKGLGRLLLFEKIGKSPHGNSVHAPELRKLEGNEGQPSPKQLKINLSALGAKSWYDSNLIRISYGPRWDAAAIKQTLQKMQIRIDYLSRFDDNGGETVPAHLIGHHHSVFYGSMADCLASICPNCPAADMNPPYNYGMGEGIQGPLRFIEQDPGQQMLTGSFHPLDLYEWEEDAYRQWNEYEPLPFMDVWPWPFYSRKRGIPAWYRADRYW